MIRISMLRNMPVVLGEQQIGFFQNACFDQTRKRVCAFVISCGIKGKRMVLPSQVNLVANEFILINGWSKYLNANQQHSLVFARDLSGLLVGCVSDYAIDRNTLEVLAVEITPGYLPSERRKKMWLYTYFVCDESNDLSIPCGFA